MPRTRTFDPTDQQLAMRDEARKLTTFKGLARAGTGKTATAEIVAGAVPQANIVYLVFNKSASNEAKERMPANTDSRTWHSLAYGATISRGMFDRKRLEFSSLAIVRAIEDDKILDPLRVASGSEEGRPAAFAVMNVLTKWANSKDERPTPAHVSPIVTAKFSKNEKQNAAKIVSDVAYQLWNQINEPHSKIPITHDFYLKAYQLKKPRIKKDMMILDEAQDQSPVMLDVVEQQRKAGMAIVAFGDSQQQIYAWRGAEDAMKHLPGKTLPLTKSWRFGPEIAHEANQVLTLLGEVFLVDGGGPSGKVVDDRGDSGIAQAVLCRGNAGVVYETLKKLDLGMRVGVVGGTKEACNLLYACFDLYQGIVPSHPEIGLFNTWDELQEFSETEDGGGYKPIVNLVESHGYGTPRLIWRLKDVSEGGETHPEAYAQVAVSTAHKAKGREWGSVEIADDFAPLTEEVNEGIYALKEEEANLQYVAITRAKMVLNMGGLGAQIQEDLVRMSNMRRRNNGQEELS